MAEGKLIITHEAPDGKDRYRVTVDQDDGNNHDAYLSPGDLIVMLATSLRRDDLRELCKRIGDIGPSLPGHDPR